VHAVLLGDPMVRRSVPAALPVRPGRTDAELFHRVLRPRVGTVDMVRGRDTPTADQLNAAPALCSRSTWASSPCPEDHGS